MLTHDARMAAAAPVWTAGPNHRSAPLVPAAVSPTKKGFTRLPATATGLNFTNLLSRQRYTTNQVHLNGSGVAAGDIDGDGFCDLYFAALDGNNVLFRNLGDWRFKDVTAESGTACPGIDATGVALADLDGDGDLDLVVNSIGAGTTILLNDGHGRFSPPPGAAVLNPGRGGMSMALADMDGDGDLDLYVANYRTVTVRDQPNIRIRGEHIDGRPVVASVDGKPVSDPEVTGRFTLETTGKIIENGEIDVLFRNDGHGRFTPLSFTDGTFFDEDGKRLTAPLYDWGLSVMFRDLDGDGSPDLYVCNDFRSPDRIWLNDGRGHFRAAPRLALRHGSLFSMGLDVADVDRDGFDDVFVVDMLSREHRRRQVQVGELAPPGQDGRWIETRPQYPRNTLLQNRGDGTYAELAWFAGVQASEWSWCPVFLDVDLDGFEDLLITNGHERDAMNADVMQRAEQEKSRRKMSTAELLGLNNLFARLDTANVAFRNRGDLTFEDASVAWGFGDAAVSHGMCLADLDGDGDLDVVMNNLNGEAGIYRNEATAARIEVRLRGHSRNPYGVGARITVTGANLPVQSQEIMAGGRYLSSDEPARTFAAGSTTNRLRIEVDWRNGKRSVIEAAESNRIYEISDPAEPTDTATPVPGSPTRPSAHAPPWFEDVSARLGHVHVDEDFDDFARQPLLPRRLSQLGPGVGWIDADADGHEDLVIGAGRGGTLRVFRVNAAGGFTEAKEAPWNRPVMRDLAGIAGWDGLVLAGQSNYEDGRTNIGCLRIFDGRRKASGESVRGESASTGPLAIADLDGDGELDVFVGGRVLPGAYPAPATSLLLRNQGGRLVPGQRFDDLALVSGALFSDLDGDGSPELVVACEWGSLRVFSARNGTFIERTRELGLAGFTGFWNGVASGDFDGDGRLDLVASNWGLNWRPRIEPPHPYRVRYGDLDGTGTMQVLETEWDAGERREVLVRGFKPLAAAMPWLSTRIDSFETFARLPLSEIFGAALENARTHEATSFASAVFLNRGDHFERRELPAEAQWTAGFGVNVADADGDGNEDVFLAQNFFGNHPNADRQDAGRGLWLRGDGRGGFRALPGQESGVLVYGEQRGSAVGDFDADGRIDLVVTQNRAETRLFRNLSARVGLRVRLRGPAGNPAGVGAQLRLKFGDRWGPVREIHAGSGYWSQDSAIQVLAQPSTPGSMWVRWPGKPALTITVPVGAREIEITPDGTTKVVR